MQHFPWVWDGMNENLGKREAFLGFITKELEASVSGAVTVSNARNRDGEEDNLLFTLLRSSNGGKPHTNSGQVIKRATERHPPVPRRMHTPPKVANLELPIDPKQQILRLNIPVNNMLTMQIRQRIRHLVDVPRAPPLREPVQLRELLVQLALARELEHEEDALLVVEVPVQAQDVGVPQVLLDLDLAPDLLLDLGRDDLGLVERLHGEDELGLDFGAHHVDAPELALAEGPPDVEVVQAPFAGFVDDDDDAWVFGVGWRREDGLVGLFDVFAKGLGAANFDKSFVTFWVGGAGFEVGARMDEPPAGAAFLLRSMAESCRVTEFREAILVRELLGGRKWREAKLAGSGEATARQDSNIRHVTVLSLISEPAGRCTLQTHTMAANSDDALFPPLTRDYILAFQFSSWHPTFAAHSIKSTIIRPLSREFREYLDADGVFVPEGSEDALAESTLSDDEKDADTNQNENESPSDSESDDEDSDEEDTRRRHYAFPELDVRIRECIKAYDAVFPKLNFTSPRDAAWLLPASSPLKCTSPADVYLLLKSSDFITHDLSPEAVFEGTIPPTVPSASKTANGSSSESASYELELVLRKWYPVDRSRELRCFVRDGVLLAISQRDTNFYEFWNEPATQDRVRTAVREFWETHVRPKWPVTAGVQHDYIFDLLLTRDLARAHIIDFNPYAPKTDPLLFSYEELAALRHRNAVTHAKDPRQWRPSGEEEEDGYQAGSDGNDDGAEEEDKHARDEKEEPGPASQSQSHLPIPPRLPVLRVIDSAAHPAATSNAPAHQHNMIPFEAVSLSSGRDIEEFADTWQASVKESMRDD
ncbi:hypothetical protein D9619_007381 [Psilocybe cf. subviscida]|uniref:Cell division cycle protein 123 n=1 Tax=Psilocybe cf. subviscida TaxID=2480587 RepID=A0A8H5B3Y8_9AGAR|nr:hypothetical protein D9619_007381 [Psilocybe cf. subviscida]